MGYEPIKDETKELYLKIWTHYAVGHFSQEQLAKLFECSPDTITNAIGWCAQNRFNFDSFILSEAAKEALESRLREMRNDLIRLKESNPINWNAVIGINRLINESEETFWQLQSVIKDKNKPVINDTRILIAEKYGYNTLMKMEERDRDTAQVRAYVDSLTDKQKRLYVLLHTALESDEGFEIADEAGATTIRMKNAKDYVEQAPNTNTIEL